jgi:chitodextrinase
MTGTASQYDIRYSISLISDANFSSAAPVGGAPSPQVAGSSESFTVIGLQLSTAYYFAVKTVDDANNWSGLSNVVSQTTTGDQTPPSAIMDLSSMD